jgi:eukaryotic-like serine/threonine-protein kinase
MRNGSQTPPFMRSGRLLDGAVDRYSPAGILHEGEAAQVIVARTAAPSDLDRWVVIKRVRQEVLVGTDAQLAFIDGLQPLRLLAHDNLCPLIDLGIADDGAYVVYPFLFGETAKEMIAHLEERGRLMTAELAAYIAAAISDALEHATTSRGPDMKPRGLSHGNIRAHNVLITYAGSVKLLDFGFEAALGIDRRATAKVPAEVGHFSPERARGDPPSHSSDLFSLGVFLWESTAGRSLFRGRDVKSTLQTIRECRVQPLRELSSDMPADFAAIVSKLLSQEPGDRYASAYDVARDLRRFLAAQRSILSPSEIARLMRESFPEREVDFDPVTRAATRYGPKRPVTRWQARPSNPSRRATPIEEPVPDPPTERALPPVEMVAALPQPEAPAELSSASADLLAAFQRVDDRVRRELASVAPPPPVPEIPAPNVDLSIPPARWRSKHIAVGAACMFSALVLVGIAHRSVREDPRRAPPVVAAEPLPAPPPPPPPPAPERSAAPADSPQIAEVQLAAPVQEIATPATVVRPAVPLPPADQLRARAQSALAKGDLSSAEKILLECVQKGDLPECHRDLGHVYRRKGNGPNAVRELRRYLAIRPQAEDAIEIEDEILDLER